MVAGRDPGSAPTGASQACWSEAGDASHVGVSNKSRYLFSGGGSNTVSLPNTAADALREGEWHDTTFVNYLRICFRWGGLPGLECQARHQQKDLAILTEGLVPM